MLGEPVAYVAQMDGAEVIFSLATWADRLRLGYSPNICNKPNGNGRNYPSAKAQAPWPDCPRGARDLAREVAAICMVREERAGGALAVAKGWVAFTANGNRLDLRDRNVKRAEAVGKRNSYVAVSDTKERWRLVDEGQDPNRVYAERRLKASAAKREKLAAPLRDQVSESDDLSSPMPPPKATDEASTGDRANG
jgi:hypothetical protein